MRKALQILLWLAGTAGAQQTLKGIVRSELGQPLPGVNVFLRESFDGALSDSAGRWVIRTALTGSATLDARRIGYLPLSRQITVGDSVALVMARQPATLGPVTVQAGAY